jgi:uncharacterized repeat protein (TIGR03803 family)
MTSMRPVQPFRRFSHLRKPLAACLLAGSVFAIAQAAPAVSTVFAFNGSVPNGGLVQGADGALYGTSSAATVVSGGLVYRSTANGSSVTSLHQFSTTEGYAPKAGLLKGSDGLMYGTTRLGATSVSPFTTGTVYRIAADGTQFEILHRFGIYSETNVNGNPKNLDGAYPESALIEGSDGYLYGVARAGGLNGTGVIFRLSRDGSGFSVLHEFGPVTSLATENLVKNVGGSSPVGTLLQAPDGYLYGTASVGGINGRGTIFRIHMDGSGFEVVHEFTALATTGTLVNVDGAGPLSGLTDGGDGFLYGVAISGGANGVGTLFVVDPNSGDPATADPNDKLLTVLHDFDTPNGSTPTAALIVGSDSRLYGVTAGGGTNSSGATTTFGTIYSIARDGTGFAKLYSFDGKDGSGPYGPLLQLDAATFVGIAAAGGKCNQGTLFSYSATGATVSGNTTCGQKKNNSGGGSVAPGLLLLFGALGLARRRRRD